MTGGPWRLKYLYTISLTSSLASDLERPPSISSLDKSSIPFCESLFLARARSSLIRVTISGENFWYSIRVTSHLNPLLSTGSSAVDRECLSGNSYTDASLRPKAFPMRIMKSWSFLERVCEVPLSSVDWPPSSAIICSNAKVEGTSFLNFS